MGVVVPAGMEESMRPRDMVVSRIGAALTRV